MVVVVVVAAVEGKNREFTQRRRGRLRKRHLMDVIKVQEKKKRKCCLLFPFSVKREIRQFHVVVVQRRHGNVQKSVMHVQSCCFARLNLLFFLQFLLPSSSSLYKLPNRDLTI